jgi:PAS domain S-box-containing protein
VTEGVTFKQTLIDRGGEAGRLIAARDWAGTSVGPIETWAQSLKSALSLLLLSPVPIVMLWGEDGVMLYNDAYSIFAGGRHPELLGSKVLEGWPEVADFNDNVMKVGLAGGTLAYRGQELFLQRHGQLEPAWMNLDYSPVLDEAGRPAGVIAIVVEITEQVHAARRAATERERLFQAFEQAPGFIVALRGPEHRVEFVNAAHRAVFSSEGWVGEKIRDAFPDLEGQGFFEILDGVFATGERFVADAAPATFTQRDGAIDTRYLTFVYEPMRDPDGAVVGVLCEGSDITAAHMAQEALRESEARFRTALEIGTVGAITFDLDGRLVDANDAFLKMSGYSRADLETYSLTLQSLTAPEWCGTVERTLAELKETGETTPLQKEYLRGDGSRWWGLFAAKRLLDGRGFKFVVDITEQKQAEMDNVRLFQAVQSANETLEQRVAERTAELEEAHEALRQAQKMEAVGQLTGGIAHDFNNLLMGISGSLELVERGLARQGVVGLDRYVQGAQLSARRAAALTQRLLAFARRQTLDPKPTDINRLVYGLEDMIRRTVGPGVTVEVVGQVGLWPARIDAAQLESALLNLAINARDAMPGGGRITIETANKWLDDRGARERELTPGQYLSICVSDSGTGIPKDIVERIFDPFFTTKPIGEGTGLGLSMVHGFVRQSGGQVRVYSEEGEGTTMCLYLPRHIGEVGAEAVDHPAIPELGAGEVVLVVDDEPTVRMLMADVLSEAGYMVLEAHDGPAGLRILQSDARIDLLITDVGLPGGMNGRQVADAARQARPGLRVLFVTGYAENAAVGNGHLPPGMEVITKPFQVADLASKVGEIIEG